MSQQKQAVITLDTGDTVSAVLHMPESPGTCGVVLAHGMSNDMNNPLILSVAEGLARNHVTSLRFNFLYRERNKKSADPEHRLIHTWQKAMDYMAAIVDRDNIIAAGKSLGARMAALAASRGSIRPSRLIFLGYPLHAPGKKQNLRDAPLYGIQQPMLFFEGTRDPFCDLALLNPILDKLGAQAQLETIENGDHSFNLPKSDKRPQQTVYDTIVNTCLDWLQQVNI